MHPRYFMGIRVFLALHPWQNRNCKERGRTEHRPDPEHPQSSSLSFKSFGSVRGDKCCTATCNERLVQRVGSPSLGCFQGANPSAFSFYLFLPAAILNSVTSGGIAQQCWENGLFQASSSQPAACEWKWTHESLRLLSTTERTKPEENFACHTVVINTKCKIFPLAWFRKYFWMSFKLWRLMTSKCQFRDWKILIFLSP